MTAPARPGAPIRKAERPLRRVSRGLLVLAAALPGATLQAQAGGSLALASDYRLRGASISRSRPVATLALDWDSPAGIYAGAAMHAVFPGRGPEFLGRQFSVGYAARLRSGLTIDIGLLNARYTRYANIGRGGGYTEAYVGLVGRALSAHVFVSPDYWRHDARSVYGSLDGAVRPARLWRVKGHAGLQWTSRALVPLGRYGLRPDWRFAAVRELGRFEVEGALSGGGRGGPLYRDAGGYDRVAATVSGSWRF